MIQILNSSPELGKSGIWLDFIRVFGHFSFGCLAALGMGLLLITWLRCLALESRRSASFRCVISLSSSHSAMNEPAGNRGSGRVGETVKVPLNRDLGKLCGVLQYPDRHQSTPNSLSAPAARGGQKCITQCIFSAYAFIVCELWYMVVSGYEGW